MPLMARPKDDDAAPVMDGANQDALAELIARSRAGDAPAMEAIYGRYKIALFNLAYRYTFDRVVGRRPPPGNFHQDFHPSRMT